MSSLKLKTGLLAGAFLCFSSLVQAKVLLPAVFSDNMVLQQKENVAFWGKARAGRLVKIRATWSSQQYQTKSDAEGNWKMTIKTPSYGGPYSITFNDGEALTLNNVMLGEVWLCSGQSNMQFPLSGVINYKEEAANASYPNIRLFQTERSTSIHPKNDTGVQSGGWQVCKPETVSGFSAVAYFFARDLCQELKVPIGLIHSSWGGTVAEAWTSAASLKTMPDFRQAVLDLQKSTIDPEVEMAEFNRKMQAWNAARIEKDPGFTGTQPTWAMPQYDSSSWNTVYQPATWQSPELSGYDGSVWLRKSFEIPESWAGKDLTLSLGVVDDDDITWFNGKEIGETTGFARKRKYTIPGELVKEGPNYLCVRVWDGGNEGGIYGKEDEVFLSGPSGEKISLAGNWSYRKGINVKELGPQPRRTDGPNRPTVLYNAMINPFIPFAIRGVIWYQGEGNAGRAYQYRTLFPLLIRDWREKFDQPDLPFYFVQLANFKAPVAQPGESAWAELREAQLKTLALPNTGMAVIIDIGEAKDIHPRNKQDVGRRLALAALAKTYGKKLVYSGPLYRSMEIKGNEVELSFDHTGSGLVSHTGDRLESFALAGEDKKFYWADARIVGDKVVLSSPGVPHPVAVRYAWADNPVASLYNKEGLPASPFRTDDWEGITQHVK